MSWMDSWSRPSKHSAVPPPLYLTAGDEVPYCHTCGRVMSKCVFWKVFAKVFKKSIYMMIPLCTSMSYGTEVDVRGTDSRKSAKRDTGKVVKYCSDRCRGRKPGASDRRIEETIVRLLNGEEGSGIDTTGARSRVVKGDHRLVVTMDEIEEVVFGSRFDPEKVYGRRKNRKSRIIRGKEGEGEWKSVDMESSDDGGDEATSEDEEDEGGAVLAVKTNAKVRPPQTESDVNGSIGGERGKAEKIEETAGDAMKRHEGQRKAVEREMVRRAARRGIVFGFETSPAVEDSINKKGKKNQFEAADAGGEQPRRRKCEALMQGSVVEPSFAKGNWSVRWRE